MSTTDDVLDMSVVRWVRGIGGVCEMCMYLARGEIGRGERIGFGLDNLEGVVGEWDVCHCLVCGGVWVEWVADFGHGGWSGVMYVCVVSLDYLWRWQVQVSVYCAQRITAHLRCTQCSILLHLIDICFITCICLQPISQIETFFGVYVSTSPVFMRSNASYQVGPHGRLAKKCKSVPHCWGHEGSTQCAQ